MVEVISVESDAREEPVMFPDRVPDQLLDQKPVALNGIGRREALRALALRAGILRLTAGAGAAGAWA